MPAVSVEDSHASCHCYGHLDLIASAEVRNVRFAVAAVLIRWVFLLIAALLVLRGIIALDLAQRRVAAQEADLLHLPPRLRIAKMPVPLDNPRI